MKCSDRICVQAANRSQAILVLRISSGQEEELCRHYAIIRLLLHLKTDAPDKWEGFKNNPSSFYFLGDARVTTK